MDNVQHNITAMKQMSQTFRDSFLRWTSSSPRRGGLRSTVIGNSRLRLEQVLVCTALQNAYVQFIWRELFRTSKNGRERERDGDLTAHGETL